MFLTLGALFILVVDLHAYSVRNSPEDALDQWLDILQSRVPGAVVLLVGTHSDLFGANLAESSARTDGFKRGRSWGRIVTVVMCTLVLLPPRPVRPALAAFLPGSSNPGSRKTVLSA